MGIETTQADRDAAADYLDGCGMDWGACGDIRSGRVEHPVVEALARYRLATKAELIRSLRHDFDDWPDYVALADVADALEDVSVEPRNDGGEIIADIMALDKAIDDFLADLRNRASWDKMNVDDDGTVTLPCGNGVLYRLGCAREAMGKHVARHYLKATPPEGDAT